jgi:hypothetical protein
LWYDGKKGSTSYLTYRTKINSQLSIPSNVTIHTWGSYTPLRGTGGIYASFRNDSTGVMRGSVRFVLIEDSLYYAGPNADPWHNHVARDYLPDTNGTYIQLNPGDSAVVYRDFTVDAAWDYTRCWIITWYQRDSLYADSSKPVYQSGIKKVSDLLVQVEEGKPWTGKSPIAVFPNPCIEGTNFSFSLPAGTGYTIAIYDLSGKKVRTLSGAASPATTRTDWNGYDDNGMRVTPGVYFYIFRSGALQKSGKIIIG